MVNDLPPGERDLAMVFQNYGLYPHMTVAENIGYPLKVARVPREERAPPGARPPPSGSSSASCSTAARRRSPAASASAWRSAARSCARRSSS